MLILLFIFALIRHLHGAPFIVSYIPDCNPADLFTRNDPISNHLGNRQVSDIIISCLVTIFACTWTAIHPNIPGPCDSGWEILKRQVTTMVYAILAPEAVTGWALRQNFAAREIVSDYNNEIGKKYSLVERTDHSWFRRKPLPTPLGKEQAVAWTITHGFFLQMGGFMLSKDGVPVQTLNIARIKTEIANGRISPPTTTGARIQDKSKGDGLSKAIVVLQTTWFIVQCIVRWSSSLPVTELEIVTLGFAMLNGITYGLWWSKPQSVELPVYLEIKTTRGNITTGLLAGDVVEVGDIPERKQCQEEDARTMAVITEDAPPAKLGYLAQKLQKDIGAGWHLIWRVPYRVLQAAIRPLSRMMDFSETYVYDGDLRVPMFNSAGIKTNVLVYTTSSGIATVFGLIHFIPAWFLHFSSRPEMILWRICAGIITIQPISLGMWTWKENGFYEDTKLLSSPIAYVGLFGLPLYVISRLALIVLALISLRKLDGEALVTVDWISFIPHI